MKIEIEDTVWAAVADSIGQQGSDKPPSPQALGWLGRIFGGRYASTNITGLVIVAAISLLFVVEARSEPGEHSREIVTGMVGLISLSLGYLFGSSRVR